MAIKRGKSETVPLTPELARELKEMTSYRGERRLQKHRMAAIQGWIDRGEFKDCVWSWAWLNGVRYRTNGQHTSAVLMDNLANFPKGVKVHIEECFVDEEAELGQLFQRYDNASSSRSAQDIVGAAAAHMEGFASIARSNLMRIANGIVWHMNRGAVVLSVGDRTRGLFEDPDFVVAVQEFVKKPICRRVPVIAAMHASWEKDSGGFLSFWNAVITESDPDPGAPTRALSRFLRELANTKESRSADSMIYAKCIHAWNAFRRHTTTNLNFFKYKKLPEPV